MKYFIFALCYFLIISCQKNSSETDIILPTEIDKLTIKVDTVKVETPGTAREFPYSFPSLNFSGENFVGLDERTGKINVYDITTLKLIDTISLFRQGPNAVEISMIGSIYYYNKDSIFVLQHIPNRILMLNNRAEIKWDYDLNQSFSRQKELNGLLGYAWFDRIGLVYNNDKLYFALSQNQAKQNFINPMIGYYDFDYNSINIIDIKYPDFYTDNSLLGYYDTPGILFLDNDIIVTFPYSADILIYSYQGELIKHVKSPSEFPTGRPQRPNEEMLDHYNTNPFYRGVQPVNNGNYYLFYGNYPVPKDTGKETYKFTIIYNKDFSKYFVVNKNEKPISFGGNYFYYPIPPETTEHQLMERYYVDME